jgi:hypothetical protein
MRPEKFGKHFGRQNWIEGLRKILDCSNKVRQALKKSEDKIQDLSS